MLENTAKAILSIAEAFDAIRSQMRAVLPEGEGLNLVLTTLGDAERRAVRAFYGGMRDG